MAPCKANATELRKRTGKWQTTARPWPIKAQCE